MADTSSLPEWSSTLALAIVKAVLASTDHKIAEERKRHETEVCQLKKQIESLKDQRDELESYGRRNTLVISGSQLPKSATNEDTYSIAVKTINDNVGLSIIVHCNFAEKRRLVAILRTV